MPDRIAHCCRVLVCEDQKAVRDAVSAAVNALAQFEVIGHAGDARSCLDVVSATDPDLLILDVSLPGGGPRLMHAVKDASPGTYLLVYSGHQDEQTQLAAFAAGADRFLVKTGRLAPPLRAVQDAWCESRQHPGPDSQANSRQTAPASSPAAADGRPVTLPG